MVPCVLTGEGVWGPPEDREEAIRVLKRAVELGINFIDTADSYGPYVSEELIAEALYPYPEGVIIATKGGFMRSGPGEWQVNTHPAHLRQALEGSLKRLKLKSIDLYQLHRIDEAHFEKTFGFLQTAKEEGLIRHIGLSEVSVEQIQRAREFVDVVSVQNKYSVDYRKWDSVLDYCEQHDMVFIPWNPLNAGNVSAIKKLENIAKKHQANVHQVALSWLLHRSPNILLIPGTSKVKHLEDNVQATRISLTQEDMEILDQVKPVEA